MLEYLVIRDGVLYLKSVKKAFNDTFRLNLQGFVEDSTYCFTYCNDGNASEVDLDKDKDKQLNRTKERDYKI